MSNSAAGPTKLEIEAVFNRLRAQPANKSCFDCAAKAPTWSSVTYGVFICIDCSAVHRSLGVHLTFVRSTNLDTNWTWLQLRQMQLGGNANASQFFRQHNCTTTDAQTKYKSRAAQLYRDKLAALAQRAMKVHGSKLHLDNTADKIEGNVTPKTDEDFFAQCDNSHTTTTDLFENNNSQTSITPKIDLTPKSTTPTSTDQLSTLSAGAPSVDLLNSAMSPAAVQPTIGVRKIQPKKSGLGARKTGGLGATKVKTNFADIEARANMASQVKDSIPNLTEKLLTQEEELESVASMRLAYQDLSLQKTREEAKLKTIDPMKAKQMERLGMGFNLRGADVSHSALSDMETIKQTNAPKSTGYSLSSSSTSAATTTQSKLAAFDNDSFFNDYTPSMYGGSGSGGGGSSSGGGGGNHTTSKLDKHELDMMGFETIEPIVTPHNTNITTMFSGDAKAATNNQPTTKTKSSTTTTTTKNHMSSSASYGGSDSYARRNKNSNTNNGDDDDTAAVRKFGTAKGFGSDQFFANNDNAQDISSNLSRFQGSKAISSADYFNDGSGAGGVGSGAGQAGNRAQRGSVGGYPSNSANFQTPDLDDVKESVRQGVHKVAGRLSNLANDVMSSLQDKYGY